MVHEEREEVPLSFEEQEDGERLDAASILVPSEATRMDEQRVYDVEHYGRVLLNSSASRLAVAFTAEDFQQLFCLVGQMSRFDRSLETLPRVGFLLLECV